MENPELNRQDAKAAKRNMGSDNLRNLRNLRIDPSSGIRGSELAGDAGGEGVGGGAGQGEGRLVPEGRGRRGLRDLHLDDVAQGRRLRFRELGRGHRRLHEADEGNIREDACQQDSEPPRLANWRAAGSRVSAARLPERMERCR